jgi:hypothetical protein
MDEIRARPVWRGPHRENCVLDTRQSRIARVNFVGARRIHFDRPELNVFGIATRRNVDGICHGTHIRIALLWKDGAGQGDRVATLPRGADAELPRTLCSALLRKTRDHGASPGIKLARRIGRKSDAFHVHALRAKRRFLTGRHLRTASAHHGGRGGAWAGMYATGMHKKGRDQQN